VRTLHPATRFVVMLCTGEWEEYLEALRLGAEEVLRCPLQPTDVDLALIHAMRSGVAKREMAAPA
jgi:DNA-binding NtrC family response regulator